MELDITRDQPAQHDFQMPLLSLIHKLGPKMTAAGTLVSIALIARIFLLIRPEQSSLLISLVLLAVSLAAVLISHGNKTTNVKIGRIYLENLITRASKVQAVISVIALGFGVFG